MTSESPVLSHPGAAYRLSCKTHGPEAGSTDTAISFMASLDNTSKDGVDLSGLAGILVDVDRIREPQVAVTIRDALRRHTGPKSFSISTGAAAQVDLDGGVDARMRVVTRHALLLWLPEIYDESQREAGTRLVEALRAFLRRWPDLTVVLDLGVEDELDGYVRTFWPKLRKLGLEHSANGRFASGVWPGDESGVRQPCEVAFVFL